MSAFSRGEQVYDSRIYDVARWGFGVPTVYWDPPPRPAEFAFGPEPFEMWGVPFEYYIPKGSRQAYLVRSGHSEVYADFAMKLMLGRFAREATRTFAVKAYAGVTEHERKQTILREAATLAETKWFGDLEADKERVLRELRAGREAKLSRDWAKEASQPDADAAKRKEALTTAEREIGQADKSRLQALRKAEQEIAAAQQAREKAAREAQWAIESAARDRESQAREAAEQARVLKLSRPIPLAPQPGGIVFGTRIKDGVDFVVPLAHLQHILLSGVSGAGKTVLLHALLHQLVQSDQVERLVLIDLKGGVSFNRYRISPKVEVIYEMADVIRVIDQVMALMVQRQNYMRENGIEFWRQRRTFLVIDEYAEIQTEIDAADTKEAKAEARRLAANLASISRRARALGIVMVCALQRPTTDAMDAAVRNNLSCRICLRAATSQLAASMLDDLERLPVRPTELPTGEFYYYDASRGLTRLLKAQIAPGVDLADLF
ncbi:Hypothetical protein; putative FtsK/SpoIIIE family protein [Bradyrhizobium sp. ORS 278]|uniref:FtsK/SpoIIIE domain-containing protein n=1 Tax=Bradyrhizobium sp. (strain ORS 278) TaxID=114615 RepID=UPI00015083E7|nr:FtsK/SpoIIIE domain-containing protein [Bradyrhizobium sp. ORS 278]CAL80015.1 Hypothetical protein; putative FtsK/SpoIIIE family protein [Bradyrhizobium sp. ORS 278]